MRKRICFEIEGTIDTGSNVSEDDVYDAIVEMAEARGWNFSGSVRELDEDESDDYEDEYGDSDYDYDEDD